MKRKLLLGFALFTAICTFGQNMPSEVRTNGKAIHLNSFKYNWFFQVQGGGTLTFSEEHKRTDLTNLISPHVAISLGKHFSPTMSGRLQVGGWQSKNYDITKGDTYKRDYIQANVDAMLNLSNFFVPYTRDKVFNMYMLLGAGYVHTFKNDDMNMTATNSIVPRAGLQFDFRLSRVVSLNLEAMGNLMSDDFNGIVRGTKYDATVDVMAGLTFKLGGKGFKVVDVIDPTEANRLVNEIRAQQSLVGERDMTIGQKDREISSLKAQLAEKPKVIVEEPQEEIVMNAVVVFKIGRSELQDNQEINIYNAAKYFQDNPNMNIRIVGYADRSTGNPTINQRLSEERAEAVRRVLVNKYNIDASRITTEGGGDKVQPFANDEWNRVAIFTAVPKRK